jgi:hypothetical protein
MVPIKTPPFRALAVLFLAIPLLLPASKAHAWASGGHKIISLIAWEKLPPEARARTVALLEQHPEFQAQFAGPMAKDLGPSPSTEQRGRWLFCQASVWPDLVRPPLDGSKNPYEKYHRPTWHYLDLPVFANAEAESKLAGNVPKLYWKWKPGLPDFIELRLTAAQVVDKGLTLIPEASHPAPEKAVLLCWLFHVTGDLHQPCHTAALFSIDQFPKGDRGANSIQLGGPKEDNLHAFWDNLLGGPGEGFEGAEKGFRELWANAELMKAAEKTAESIDPEVWINEGAALAKESVYVPDLLAIVLKTKPHSYVKNNVTFEAVGPVDLGTAGWQKYHAAAQAAALRRAAVAGLRLAKAIEAAVKS